MSKTYTRYALVDTSGNNEHCDNEIYATIVHEDGLEMPIVADTISGLFPLMDVWADSDVIETLKPDGTLVDDNGTVFRIVRETVSEDSLSPDDLLTIAEEIRNAKSGVVDEGDE